MQDSSLEFTTPEPSEVLQTEHSFDELLDLIVGVAPQLVPGIDAVSVTVSHASGRRFETVSATSDEVRLLDAIQYRTRRGPCLEAMDRSLEIVARLPDESWPEFSDAAVLAGMASTWCLPLSAGGASFGCLNLYSCSFGRPWTEGRTAAEMLAAQVAIVLTSGMTMSALARTNEELLEAVASRTIIGQAQGVLMARETITADDAFDILRRASQRTNRKLRDIAAEIIAPFQGPGH